MRLTTGIRIGALTALALASTAGAQIAVKSNIVEEKEAARGETYTGRIVIANETTTPQTVRIYQTDYRFASDGTSNFDDPGTLPRSNASWVTPQTVRVTVPPKSEVAVPYSVKVPAVDSLKGTYWSAIMVEGAESAPEPNGGNQQVGIGSIVRYAVQVATHIASTGTRVVRFDKPAAGRTVDGDATLDFDVTTTGDRAVRPKLSAELYDATGTVVGKASKDRGLLYPGTSLRQQFAFGKIPAGTYKIVVFADTGEQKVLATQFTIQY